MASWSEFTAAAPHLASAVQELVHQYGPGLGYLATVRPDGWPRVHPVSPVITDGGLYCFVIDSPKRRDLEDNGRYALHSFPAEASDDEASLTGRAVQVTDPARVRDLATRMRAEPRVDWRLYEFTVDMAVLVRHGDRLTGGGSTGRPVRQVWRDPATRRPIERRLRVATCGAAVQQLE
jgi:hypothetical protein